MPLDRLLRVPPGRPVRLDSIDPGSTPTFRESGKGARKRAEELLDQRTLGGAPA